MVSILKTDKIQASHGTNIEIPSGHVLQAPGHIVQLVEKQDKTVASTSSTSYTNSGVSGLNLSITPKFATSKIYMTVHLSVEMTGANTGYIIFARNPAGTPVYFANTGESANLGGAGNSADGVSKYFLTQGYGGVNGGCTSHSGIDSPNTTSAVTYGILWATNSGSHPAYYNRGVGSATYVTNSSISLMEIAQ
jgi:hypothetical protein